MKPGNLLELSGRSERWRTTGCKLRSFAQSKGANLRQGICP